MQPWLTKNLQEHVYNTSYLIEWQRALYTEKMHIEKLKVMKLTGKRIVHSYKLETFWS